MRLKTILDEKNISQRKLAQMAGIAAEDLNRAINGHIPMWPGWKNRIADALEMDVDDLFPEDTDGEA